MEQILNKLKAELLKTLPGQDIQYQMAPLGRKRELPSDGQFLGYRKSAVLVLFCLDADNNWFIPLTRRFSYKGVHSGQISFPGGKSEPGDLSLKDTALRECYEEIGISEEVEILGSLTELSIPVSGFSVAPFVAICKKNAPVFVPHEREVRNIVKLYIRDLLNSDTVKNGVIEVEGVSDLKISAPYFGIEEYKIWGATAMILNELKEIIRLIF